MVCKTCNRSVSLLKTKSCQESLGPKDLNTDARQRHIFKAHIRANQKSYTKSVHSVHLEYESVIKMEKCNAKTICNIKSRHVT